MVPVTRARARSAPPKAATGRAGDPGRQSGMTERRAAALVSGETKSNRRAENHAVTRRVGADAKREENYQGALDQLLDESHLQVAEKARAVHARSSRRRTQMKSRLR